MLRHNEDSILGKIIFLSETLQGSKLEDDSLDKARAELQEVSSYLGVDEISAIFFAVIFVLQNQRSMEVNLHDIAEFLNYSFLYILEYRKNISILEDCGLVFMKVRKNVSPHPENNGYIITGTIMNNIIDNEPIIKIENDKDSIEKVFSEIRRVQESFIVERNIMNYTEYKRQMFSLEKRYENNEAVSNIKKIYPDDYDSRFILYYFCISQICGVEIKGPSQKRGCWESPVCELVSLECQSVRERNLFVEKNDILLRDDFIKDAYLESEDSRGRKILVYSFRLTEDGIKKIFGNEAKKYMAEDENQNELDEICNVIKGLGNLFQNESLHKSQKCAQLKREEKRWSAMPFFKTVQSIVKNANHRFLFYKVVANYLDGCRSYLCAALNVLYGHNKNYFSELRLFLDEKHPLLELGFLDIEKKPDVDEITVSEGGKAIELLYGKNADLYKRCSCDKNVLEPKDLQKKTLFYSENVQNQIDALCQSLEQKNFKKMQSRLKQKGLPTGIAVLLYGAPGTGKTETVFQIAKRTGRRILHVDIAESKSMWFGESEKRVKKIFTNYEKLCKECKRLKKNVPILLFNEADALISKRKDVSDGNSAQTENAIQNILLEQLEKLDGILIATTNLCENMDKAFERRFLFKIKYEKPTLDVRSKIWQSKMPELPLTEAKRLADQFDFSGGEIDNVVRKCEMSEVIKGTRPSYEEVVDLCKNERLEKEGARSIGFSFS